MNNLFKGQQFLLLLKYVYPKVPKVKTPKVYVVSPHNVMINFHDCSKVAPAPPSPISHGSTTPLLQKIILYEHNCYRLSFFTSFNIGTLYTL